jgi:hypothetical protein
VTAAQIEEVLERLGRRAVGRRRTASIWKYLTDSLKPVGHKAVEQIRALPGEAYQASRVRRVRGMSHDWRLAYLAFGLFALGLIAFPLFPAFLLAAYIAARADVSLARERGETLGARRWLIYPPMVIVSLALFLTLASWPILPSVALSHEIPRSMRPEVGEIMRVAGLFSR